MIAGVGLLKIHTLAVIMRVFLIHSSSLLDVDGSGSFFNRMNSIKSEIGWYCLRASIIARMVPITTTKENTKTTKVRI